MKALLLVLLSLLAVLAFTPDSRAAVVDNGVTVVAGTYVSDSIGNDNDGIVVSDGKGTLSFTSDAGSGAVWTRRPATGPYRKVNPKPGEENLELKFWVAARDGEGNPIAYKWKLYDSRSLEDEGTLTSK